MSFNIEQIIAKTDLRELVEKAGGQVNKSRCACPIHGGQDTNAFAIYHKDGRDYWKCFSNDCGGGDCCLLYTSPSPRDLSTSRMPSSA